MLTRRNFLLGSTALVGVGVLPALALGNPHIEEARENELTWCPPQNPFNGKVVRVVRWDRRLSNGELAALTAA